MNCAGASAWDNAATALEYGAAAVDMYVRRPALLQTSKARAANYVAFYDAWPSLDPDDRWRLHCYLQRNAGPPPFETVHRTLAAGGKRFSVHFETTPRKATLTGECVALHVDAETKLFDLVILGTGFDVDIRRDRLVSGFSDRIATWADISPGTDQSLRSRTPWLGSSFELLALRDDPAGSDLSRIRLFNHAAAASLGLVSSDIPGAETGAGILARGLVFDLVRDNLGAIENNIRLFNEFELESTPFFKI
ncbi:MAG: hypothetical protein KBG72_00155 [Agrobacterium sp.]|nr:hypothetical protein [Agrobacterium sp.]